MVIVMRRVVPLLIVCYLLLAALAPAWAVYHSGVSQHRHSGESTPSHTPLCTIACQSTLDSGVGSSALPTSASLVAGLSIPSFESAVLSDSLYQTNPRAPPL